MFWSCSIYLQYSLTPDVSVAALADVSEVVEQLQGSLNKMENFQKLLELKKDLIGVNDLVVPSRVGSKLKEKAGANVFLIL